MGLELYAKVEPYLDFDEEIYYLHKEFLKFIMENDIDNIIDIGCGQGHFLQNLKINKKKHLGIDLSSEQVNICKGKKLNAKNILLEDIKEKFDCATAIFDVLNYISKNEFKKFISQTYNILNNNSYFLFDVNSYYGFEEIAQGSINIDANDKFISIDAYFNDNILQTNITLFEKQENNLFSKKSDVIIQEYHTKEFIIDNLQECNFNIIEIRNIFLHNDEKPDKFLFICKK